MKNQGTYLMELAAIWLNVKINGSRRIQQGDYIAVEGFCLIDATHATHKILGCFGDTHSSRLEIMIVDVITNEPRILRLK